MTSKTILFQRPCGSEVYNTLDKKAEAPAMINNDLNNSNCHLIANDFEANEDENGKEADVSNVEIIEAQKSKDETYATAKMLLKQLNEYPEAERQTFYTVDK